MKIFFSAVVLVFDALLGLHHPPPAIVFPPESATLLPTKASTLAATSGQLNKVSVTGFQWVPLSDATGTSYALIDNAISFAGVFIHGVDASQFMISVDQRGVPTAYAKDGRQIYYISPIYKNGLPEMTPASITIVSQADAATFEVLYSIPDDPQDSYGVDSRFVYHNATIITGADPTKFRVVLDGNGLPTHYDVDGKHVFFDDYDFGDEIMTKVLDVDPSTFKYLNSIYIRDDRHVYDQIGSVIPGADPGTFEVLAGSYARDKNNVYNALNGTPGYLVEGADPSSFVSLKLPRSCGVNCTFDAFDKIHMYLMGKEM